MASDAAVRLLSEAGKKKGALRLKYWTTGI